MCVLFLAKVYPIKVEFGEGISLESIQQTIQQAGGKVDIVWVVHAETSTGIYLSLSSYLSLNTVDLFSIE